MELRGKRVLMVSALDRFGMAQALVAAGADVIFGDFIFALDLDRPVRGLHEFEEMAHNICPTRASCRSSFSIRPARNKRPPEPKYPQYYEEAEIIAGDFHFMRQYMPDRLDGKIVLTNTLTSATSMSCATRRENLDHDDARFRGRSFGTNVVEAALLALLGKTWADVTPRTTPASSTNCSCIPG